MLTTLDYLPESALHCAAAELYQVFEQPTLVHLSGQQQTAPLFVSCLLHGNETSGFIALQQFFQKYDAKKLPYPISILFGNVQAARAGRRHLDEQPDFNRIWFSGSSPENQMAMAVLGQMKGKGCYACIDIHNTTGRNPCFACVASSEIEHMALAKSFSNTVLYFPDASKMLVGNFAKFCPAVALESGLPGDEAGIHQVIDFIDLIYRSSHVPLSHLETKTELLQPVATISVPEIACVNVGGSGEYGKANAGFDFIAGIDQFNFTLVPSGTKWGEVHGTHSLQVVNQQGEDISQKYFDYRNGEIVNKISFMPSLITENASIIKSDCLGYVLEPMNVTGIAQECVG